MGFWTKKMIKIKYVYKTIHNKFNVNDTVCMIVDGGIFITKVEEVSIYIKEDYIQVFYTLKDSPYGRSGKVRGFYENELFASKEDVANFILKKY